MKDSHLLFINYQVYSQAFWMMCYGSPTPKRTKVYSNSRQIGGLDIGKKPKAVPQVKLVKKYVDKNGKQRCVGLKALKMSQFHT